MGSEATPRVLDEWRNRVAAEYTSAALTAQALHWMIEAAFPEDVVDVAHRIVGDELAHARLSHACLVDLGGESLPIPVHVERLAMPAAPAGLLASLTDTVVRNFCFGETFAVPLFAAMREHTTHPAARPVLDRVLRDEAVHRAFGWDALDVLISMDPDGVRQRVQASLPRWRVAFHRAYGDPPDGEPLTDVEKSMGLLDLAVYREVHDKTIERDIRPRFAKRGIVLE